jgi:hypothetical protein
MYIVVTYKENLKMVQRLTVTISDELNERLQNVKSKFNISGVCQSALEKVIEFEEFKLKIQALPEKYKLKLQKEKEIRLKESAKEAKEQAFQDGFIAPEKCDFKYEDFLIFEKGDLPKWFDEWFPRYIDTYTQRIDHQSLEHFDYKEVFIEGILGYWKEIKDKV